MLSLRKSIINYNQTKRFNKDVKVLHTFCGTMYLGKRYFVLA